MLLLFKQILGKKLKLWVTLTCKFAKLFLKQFRYCISKLDNRVLVCPSFLPVLLSPDITVGLSKRPIAIHWNMEILGFKGVTGYMKTYWFCQQDNQYDKCNIKPLCGIPLDIQWGCRDQYKQDYFSSVSYLVSFLTVFTSHLLQYSGL